MVDLVKVGHPSTPFSTSILSFNEDAGAAGPRVIANCESFLAYTLRNRSTLRFVSRGTNTKGILKTHTNPISAVQFLETKDACMGASLSTTELLYWKVKEDKEKVTVELRVSVALPSLVRDFFLFMNAERNVPDVFVVYDKKASVVDTSKYAVGDAPKTPIELEKVSRALRILSSAATDKSSCCYASLSKRFVFTHSKKEALACNLNTPAASPWPACNGNELQGLASVVDLNNTVEFVFASSATAVYQWVLPTSGEGEPQLIRKLAAGGPVTMLLSCADTVAIIAAKKTMLVECLPLSGAPATEERHPYRVTVFDLPDAPQRRATVFEKSPGCGSLVMDAGVNIWKHQVGMPTEAGATARSSRKAEAPYPDTQAPPAVRDSAILAMSASPTAPVEDSAAAVPIPPAPPAPLPRVTLTNAALPHNLDGVVAAATYQSDEKVRRQLEGLQNVIMNVAKIIQLAPDQINRDHEQLVNLSLEAQMTELQSIAARSPAGSASGSSRASAVTSENEASFNRYAIDNLSRIADGMAVGVVSGLNESIRTEVDKAVSSAFDENLRASQKNAIKQHLEDALKDSAAFFTAEITNRLEKFATVELTHCLSQVSSTVLQLREDNRRLLACVQQLTDASGPLSELESLRKEVEGLRETVKKTAQSMNQAGGTDNSGLSNFAGRTNPETVLTTANKYADEGSYTEAMKYLVLSRQPSLILRFLQSLPEERYDVVMSPSTVSDDVWSQVCASLVRLVGPSSTVEEVERMAEVLFDILSTLSPSSVARVKNPVSQFIQQAQTLVAGPCVKVDDLRSMIRRL